MLIKLFNDILMLYSWLVGWIDSAQDESDIAKKNIRAQPDSLTVSVTSSCQCMRSLIKNMERNNLSERRLFHMSFTWTLRILKLLFYTMHLWKHACFHVQMLLKLVLYHMIFHFLSAFGFIWSHEGHVSLSMSRTKICWL